MTVLSTSSLSVYTKVLAHNLNGIRNWASLIGLLFRICWCLFSIFLVYCSDEWKKLVNLIYCFQVLFRMNFKIMYFLMKVLGNTPSADSAASRDSLSSQNATCGIVFFSSFYWWHIEYKGWMCERLLNLQEIYVSGQNICIEVYGNSVGTITPVPMYLRYLKWWPSFLLCCFRRIFCVLRRSNFIWFCLLDSIFKQHYYFKTVHLIKSPAFLYFISESPNVDANLDASLAY